MKMDNQLTLNILKSTPQEMTVFKVLAAPLPGNVIKPGAPRSSGDDETWPKSGDSTNEKVGRWRFNRQKPWEN